VRKTGRKIKDGAAQTALLGPVRMCAVCRERFPKRELTRFVRAGLGLARDGTDPPGGGFVEDPEQKLPGRGLYLCRRPECRERFAKRKDRRQKRKGDSA
jgi:predicted RNA-binding protein YlxR (DUF448 family)